MRRTTKRTTKRTTTAERWRLAEERWKETFRLGRVWEVVTPDDLRSKARVEALAAHHNATVEEVVKIIIQKKTLLQTGYPAEQVHRWWWKVHL